MFLANIAWMITLRGKYVVAISVTFPMMHRPTKRKTFLQHQPFRPPHTYSLPRRNDVQENNTDCLHFDFVFSGKINIAAFGPTMDTNFLRHVIFR